MSGQQNETEQYRLLVIVENAVRAGHTESEIVEIVDAAVEADAELNRAA